MEETKDERENVRTALGARQILTLAAVASTTICIALTISWSAVLPKLEEDTTHYSITKEDVSWLVSLIPIVGIITAIFTGSLVEYLGPRRLLLLIMLPMAGFWVLMAYAPYLSLLYIGRAAIAVCCCFMNICTQPLMAELCPSKNRGLFSSLSENIAAVTIMLGYILAHFLPWNLATAVSAVPCVVLFLLFLFAVPESPYWLMRHNKKDEAEKALQQMMGPGTHVTDQLDAMMTASPTADNSFKHQVYQLRKGENVRPLLLLLLIFLLRETGGRNALISYSVYLFRQAQVELDPFICTIMLGAIRILGQVISVLTMDRLGRKPNLICSSLMCGLTIGVTGLFLIFEWPGKSWVCIVFPLLFITFYGLGVAPIPWVYMGELLPTPIRGLGASIIIFSYNVVNFTVNYVYFSVTAQLGLGLTLLVFSIPNFLLLIITIFWLPETRGLSLEELQMAFHKRK